MADKNSPKSIRVTFRDNDFDSKLYADIIEDSKVIGQSSWMKQAAYEYLRRDKKISNDTGNNVSGNPVIKSLEDMFKK
jgi:hypothetical protein